MAVKEKREREESGSGEEGKQEKVKPGMDGIERCYNLLENVN